MVSIKLYSKQFPRGKELKRVTSPVIAKRIINNYPLDNKGYALKGEIIAG